MKQVLKNFEKVHKTNSDKLRKKMYLNDLMDLKHYVLEVIQLNIEKGDISDKLIISNMVDEPDTKISITLN